MRGSIRRKRRKYGIGYEVVVDLGPDPLTGRRRQRSRTYHTRREADKALRDWIREIEHGYAGDGRRMTAGELIERWLREEARLTVRESTYPGYALRVRKHLLPAFGKVLLVRLTPAVIQAKYVEMVDSGVSPEVIRQSHVNLGQALKYGQRLGLVSSLPTAQVTLPRREHRQGSAWTLEQMRRFMEVARGRPLGLFYMLALTTGMRRGELLGLRWQDVDLDAGRLMVRQAYSMVGTRPKLVAETKTAGSVRTVALSPSVLLALRAHRERQEAQRQLVGDDWHDLGMVLSDGYGRPVHPCRVMDEMRRLVDLAAIPKLRIQDLRHMQVSLLLAAGVSIPEVSKRVGHKRASMTLDVYAHVLGDDRTASVVESALFDPS